LAWEDTSEYSHAGRNHNFIVSEMKNSPAFLPGEVRLTKKKKKKSSNGAQFIVFIFFCIDN